MDKLRFDDIKKVVDCDETDKVADYLIETGCYLIDLSKKKKDWYHWKSGIIAPCYCNCRGLISTIEQRKEIAQFLAGSIKKNYPKADCIAGMATAGIPWASMVGFILDLPIIYIRKVAKQHGVSKRIEGSVNNIKNIVLVDDLIASGESILDAIHVIQHETCAKVIGIQSIINWGFSNMFELLRGYQIHSLASYEQIIISASKHKLISADDIEVMLNFYKNPFEYDWGEFYEKEADFRF